MIECTREDGAEEKRLVEMFRENRPAEKTRGLGKALGNTVREQQTIALK